jgi:hypothetical protein
MPRTPPPPDPPRLRQISAICGRSTPCVDALRYAGRWPATREIRSQALKSEATGFALIFVLSFVADRAGTCPWPGGWAAQGVSRMDAATEPTWTYLQRPLRSPPARPTPKSRCSRDPPQPRGLRRWPPTARSAAPPNPEPCACSRIDHAIDDNVVPTWRRTLSPASRVPPSAPPSPSRATPGPASRAAPSGPARPLIGDLPMYDPIVRSAERSTRSCRPRRLAWLLAWPPVPPPCPAWRRPPAVPAWPSGTRPRSTGPAIPCRKEASSIGRTRTSGTRRRTIRPVRPTTPTSAPVMAAPASRRWSA